MANVMRLVVNWVVAFQLPANTLRQSNQRCDRSYILHTRFDRLGALIGLS